MKRLENKSMIKLLYLIAIWCYANKAMPHKIEINAKETENGTIYYALIYHCPHENTKEDDMVIEQQFKSVPRIPEHVISDDMDEIIEREKQWRDNKWVDYWGGIIEN